MPARVRIAFSGREPPKAVSQYHPGVRLSQTYNCVNATPGCGAAEMTVIGVVELATLENIPFRFVSSGSVDLSVGEQAHFNFDPEMAHLFPKKS